VKISYLLATVLEIILLEHVGQKGGPTMGARLPLATVRDTDKPSGSAKPSAFSEIYSVLRKKALLRQRGITAIEKRDW